MDEELAEDVASVDAGSAAHLQYQDGEHFLKPENFEIPEPKEAPVQEDASSPDSSFDVIAEMLDGKNVNLVNQRESPPCSIPQSVDNVGDVVEELTVRNCDGSNVGIVGTSGDRERLEKMQNQLQHPFLVGCSSPSRSSQSKRENNETTPSTWQDTGKVSLPESSTKQIRLLHGEANEHKTNVERDSGLSKTLSHLGIKTKIFSQSGFSQFFVKTTLKGKGITIKGPLHNRYKAVGPENQSGSTSGRLVEPSNTLAKVSSGPVVAHDISLCSPSRTIKPSYCAGTLAMHRVSRSEGLSLREWLKSERHKVEKAECLYVFRQIIDLVDYSHSQGVFLHDLRPSFFKMLKESGIKYGGSCFRMESSDKSLSKDSRSHLEIPFVRGRPMEIALPSNPSLFAKRQKLNDSASLSQWPLFRRAGINIWTENDDEVNVVGTRPFHGGPNQSHSSTAFHLFTPMSEELEKKWYASPEELSRGVCSMSSNIYSLGILLFEVLSRFDSERAREAAMSDIRHRILPPNFLSENPKEAGFCLWLLHPEPSCRPTTRDIIQSEVINEIPARYAEGLSLSIEQEDTESELLLHFLVSSHEQKQKRAARLMEEMACLEADIKEIERRRSAIRPLSSDDVSNSPEMRLIWNIRQLESAYFSARIHAHLPEAHPMVRADRDLLRNNGNSYSSQENVPPRNPSDRVGAFFDGLCKYARYSKFEMRGVLRTGEFNNSANVICSLGFDRNEDFFAAAGVSKKIKIFEFNSIFNSSVDIHYPAVEMPNRSRLSCVCWNNYIRNYLTSSDYDGIIKLWDVTTGQAISHFIEHEKRAWSVDFSRVYPTKLASGSDDCSVKLWNINERNCLGTIRNIANVCCVQFSPHSAHLLAFGSADYRTYCYDLRNLRGPWCVLSGHDKAVSYVKFLDHETLVTASTDNTLKLWDLKKTSHGGLSTNACGLTFGGHTNEKNFIGLSAADGYIACGSETNEVYAYYRSLPMPITSYKFGSIDPISGGEIDDDSGLFVSSVCWRTKSNMVIAANSSGCIKVLQLV